VQYALEETWGGGTAVLSLLREGAVSDKGDEWQIEAYVTGKYQNAMVKNNEARLELN
jgi:hypothetical protein